MLASRHALRATRHVRVQPFLRTARRLDSTARPSKHPPPGVSNDVIVGGLVGGLVGGGVVALLGYAYYHYSGASTVINAVTSAQSKFEEAFEKSVEKAPASSEAIRWLRETAMSYVGFIPGAKGYVNKAFDEIEVIQRKHGEEVEKIVEEARNQLEDLSKESASLDTVTKAWDIVQTALKRIGELATDSIEDILNKYPELKSIFGGSLDQFNGMGDGYGADAKEIVDETWEQVRDILQGGIGLGTADQLRRLIEEKTQEVRKIGEKAWQKGIEQATPYLDKNPKVKELVLQNKDELMQGNLTELWEQVQSAGRSGDMHNLEKFIKEMVDKGKSRVGGSGGGLGQFLSMIPGGSETTPKFQQLEEIAEKHGDEAQVLIKKAFKEIQEVLGRTVEKGKKPTDKGGT